MFNLSSKEIVRSFRRDDGTYFDHFVMGRMNGKIYYAYIQPTESGEKLMLEVKDGDEPAVEIYRARYISSPVVTAHGVLFSVCVSASVWNLCAASVQNGKVAVRVLNGGTGKRSFIAVDSTETYVVYEKREGVHTNIGIIEFAGGRWSDEKDVTDGTVNCSDPSVAVNGDLVYVICSCFFKGNYNIFMYCLNRRLEAVGDPVRLSDQKGACAWPTVWPREKGGVWVCWSAFTREVEFESSYLQHEKYAARRRLYTNSSEVYAGVFEAGRLYFPETDAPHKNYIEPLLVNHATTSKYPQIFELDHEVYLLLRRFSKPENKMQSSADVSVMTLTTEGWTEPSVLIGRGLHENPASFRVCDGGFEMVSYEDHRKTGWSRGGEHFDGANSIDVLYMKMSLDRSDWTPSTGKIFEHFISNACFPSMEEDPYVGQDHGVYRLIWGQTHNHTNLSVCQRMNDQNIDFNFRFFQDVQKSLFGAVSDHDYNMWDIEKRILHKKVDYYYFPGEFIALPCYEWTGSGWDTAPYGGPFGHMNPLYCEESGEMDIHVAEDPADPGRSPDRLWSCYRGQKIVTIPHHTADGQHKYNWDYYDSTFVPIVEIFQDCRGEQEQLGVMGSTGYWKSDEKGHWVLDALKRGYKLGFIGGGDHSGTARGGAEVTELTREALYDALIHRRCYASSGAGADLKFTANGQPVGSIVIDDVCRFHFRACTNDPMVLIELVKNGEAVRQFRNQEKSFEYDFTAKREENQNFYYFRVCTENGEVFWTSPIWHGCAAEKI